jgi:hypothetical protein
LGTSGRDITVNHCISVENGFTGFSVSARNAALDHCIARQNGMHGFDVQINLHVTIGHCIASKNVFDGFFLSDALGGGIVLKDSLATFNGNFGIEVIGGAGSAILDTRSFGNIAGDLFGVATVISY